MGRLALLSFLPFCFALPASCRDLLCRIQEAGCPMADAPSAQPPARRRRGPRRRRRTQRHRRTRRRTLRRTDLPENSKSRSAIHTPLSPGSWIRTAPLRKSALRRCTTTAWRCPGPLPTRGPRRQTRRCDPRRPWSRWRQRPPLQARWTGSTRQRTSCCSRGRTRLFSSCLASTNSWPSSRQQPQQLLKHPRQRRQRASTSSTSTSLGCLTGSSPS